MRVAFALSVAATATITACGGRTQLVVEPPDAGGPTIEAPGEAPLPVPPGSPCSTDADCASSDYCSMAHCDPASGCVLAPRSCDDGIACTRDACNGVQKRCEHAPDDARCPDTQLCSARRGCDAFVYAVASDGHAYEVRIPSGQLVDLGLSAASLGDIALDSNGILYATDSYILYRIDRATSGSTTIASILPLHLYSGLGVANGTSLLATADVPQLFEIGSTSGSALSVAPLVPGYTRTGDVTALGSRVLVTMASGICPSTDTLVQVDLSAHGSSVIGDVRYCCVWGLATLGGRIYGLTCEGRILAVDAASGGATEIARARLAFLGAAGR